MQCVAGSYPYKWSDGILLSTGRGPTFVGGGFSFNILFFKCSPKIGEMIQFDEHIFGMGRKPPTM